MNESKLCNNLNENGNNLFFFCVCFHNFMNESNRYTLTINYFSIHFINSGSFIENIFSVKLFIVFYNFIICIRLSNEVYEMI